MKTPHSSDSLVPVFHEGEVFAQDTLGISKTIAQRTQGFIRPFMPVQHRAFFESGPLMMVGLLDQSGHPVALPVWGDEGFVRSPSETRLQLGLSQGAFALIDTLLGLDVNTGSKIGILGLELATRRRNRLNGVISHLKGSDIHVSVEQSFGNCPQYIHTRDTQKVSNLGALEKVTHKNVQRYNGLTTHLQQVVSTAETFYIASRHATLGHNSNEGIDVSHRGGKSGFINVEANSLLIPDFSGNKFFNTIGNIVLDGRVGLCFFENTTGTLHFIQGNATVIWETDTLPDFDGAERFIHITVENAISIDNLYPFRHEVITRSPAVDSTGVW